MPEEIYELKPFKYSSHYWILKLLEQEKSRLRILDVGAATGYLGKILRQRGHYVAGIECNPEWAGKARPGYDAFECADIEQFPFPQRSEFDYILFGDVLEHLRDPAAVLRRALPSLKDSGKFILSVPNVANFTTRLGLLSGRFDYTERGILDHTHLRFFTLRSLTQMLREAACRVVRVVPTPVPVQLVLPITEKRAFAPVHEVHYAVVRLWKTMFAYQFVVTAAPDSSRRSSPPH